jgi:hypothetical protein
LRRPLDDMMMSTMPARWRDLVATLALAGITACGGSPGAPVSTDAAAPGAADATASLAPDAAPDAARAADVGPDAGAGGAIDASGWPDAAPGTVLSCGALPPETEEVLLAGAFTSLWIEPMMEPREPPTADFQEEVSGVLSVDGVRPPGAPVLEATSPTSTGDRFAVTANDGRRLTVSYDVEFGRDMRPLAAALRTLAGKKVSLRYVARQRAGWSTAFVVADHQGIALAFDGGLRGHTLTANDLAGLTIEPGPIFCAYAESCPGYGFRSLRITGASDVEIPPTEQGHFTFAGNQYTAANIRHDGPAPGCDGPGFFWAAWALWRQ